MTIDEYVDQAKKDGTALIDVRPKEMFDEGHIPGAVSIPLAEIPKADVAKGSYVYCLSGYHAGLAKEDLAKRHIDVTNIGGIEDYHGPIARA